MSDAESSLSSGGRLRLGVLVSGNGSNLQAILDACRSGELGAEVALVLSNKPGVRALERAAASATPSAVVPHRDYACREDFERELLQQLREARVDWVVLAGFMRVLSPHFLSAFRQRIVNIHPSLLPAFPGIDAQRQALEYGVKVTGCTVHLVDEGVDTGPIIEQRIVPIEPEDTLEALKSRIHAAEHRALVAVLCGIAEGRLRLRQAESGRWCAALRTPEVSS